MAKFRLMGGQHTEGEKNPDGTMKIYHRGDIVTSDKPLDKLFNAPGSEKFRRIFSRKAKEVEGIEDDGEDEATSPSNSTNEVDDNLDNCSVNDLRGIALDEGIDLEGATKKTDIIRVIREARSEMVG